MKQIATVDKIISVRPCLAYDVGWDCDVLCTDGKIRKLSNSCDGDNVSNLDGYAIIKQGYQFEFEHELPPRLCNPDYKIVYETIDNFLVESENVLLGNVMKALHGRINPAEAQKIIKQRLLIDK